MTLRAAGRLCWFLGELGVVLVGYVFTAAFASNKSKRRAQAVWLHRSARRHIRIYGCAYSASGPIPRKGLLVMNHLSYLDILVISALTPAIFVSKSEVRNWPLFGWLASLGGTLFIQRERRTHVGVVNREIESALADGVLVVVFPEGTSTNGDDVLPFRSSLLEPVTTGTHPITVGCMRYELEDGDAREDVCYWGDHEFFPHTVNLLGKRRVRATVQFSAFQRTTADRKELARQLHEAVLELKPKN
jgi:1-acyl-sn-glycerol-3-phosphate acyltransferase